MDSYLPLTFIQEKIAALETALLYNHAQSVLKFPNSIIKVLNVDDVGQIWFCLPAPQQSIREFDRAFSVELRFFRKNHDFNLRIEGQACLVDDPEELAQVDALDEEVFREVCTGRSVLVKVRIQCADYFAVKPRTKRSSFHEFLDQLIGMFRQALRSLTHNEGFHATPHRVSHATIVHSSRPH